MRHLLILTLVLMLSASLAFAQAGSIGLFADETGTSCNVVDDAASPGLCSIFVLFVNHGGITGAQFMCPLPACMQAQYMSWSSPWPVKIGDPVQPDITSGLIGIAIGTGSCQAAPTLLVTLNFFCQGLTGDCCYYGIQPAEGIASGSIEGVDCDFTATFPTGGECIVNSNAGCDCDVPTHETTWGAVKAMFVK
jgi:hypothetical protein